MDGGGTRLAMSVFAFSPIFCLNKLPIVIYSILVCDCITYTACLRA